MSKEIRIKLREDRNVTNFDTAVEEATRLQDIKDSEDPTPEPDNSETMDQAQPVWKVEENRQSRTSTKSSDTTDRSRSPYRPKVYFADDMKRSKTRSRRPPIVCHKCEGLNHIARNCMANF